MQDLKQDDLEKVSGGTEAGDVCRDSYAATGGLLGGILTSESFGWGAVPGAILGGMIGRRVCPK
ncbi:MAG TPA: hypothetical protein VMZ53_02375 [Kofleriaceae bacterium]|nr:hypothetical protein [Kofleriaceae bacterium]